MKITIECEVKEWSLADYGRDLELVFPSNVVTWLPSYYATVKTQETEVPCTT